MRGHFIFVLNRSLLIKLQEDIFFSILIQHTNVCSVHEEI